MWWNRKASWCQNGTCDVTIDDYVIIVGDCNDTLKHCVFTMENFDGTVGPMSEWLWTQSQDAALRWKIRVLWWNHVIL